jgi:geranylgeranyl reductase family protein
MFDVAIVGSGPAGASCAAFCARAGLRTLLLERETFPREKVCGDCLNPSCWPVLKRLGLSSRVRALPHGGLERLELIAIGGKVVSIALPRDGEIAVKRSLFDQVLMHRAIEEGAQAAEGATVTAIVQPKSPDETWQISTEGQIFHAATLVAADGRNSTVARLLGLLPKIERERIGLQTHIPLPAAFGKRVVLREGYSGQAPVSEGELNLCLVGKPAAVPALRRWAETNFGVARDHVWRTITPLRRAALLPARAGLFLVGDAARVVEPFTGEGIYYALRSGELAAEAIVSSIANRDHGAAARRYSAAHARLYRGRLWVNRIARAAVLSPRITSALLRAGILHPQLVRVLTTKIVG